MKNLLSLRAYKNKNSLFRGSLLAIINKLVALLIGFITIPLTLNYLGKERYGLLMVTLSTFSFTSFLDMGITPTIKNRLSEAFADNDEIKFRYYANGAISIGTVIFCIAILLAFASTFFDWAKFLNVKNIIAIKETNALVFVVVFYLLFSLALGMVDSIYISRLQISILKIYNLVAAIIGFFLLLFGIFLRVSLPLLAILTVISGIIFRFILFIKLILHDKRLIEIKFNSSLELVKQLLPSSMLFMGIQASSVVMSALPNILIAKFLDLEKVTIFSIAYKFITIPLFLIAEILPVFWPNFTIAWKKGQTKWLRKSIFRVTFITLILLMSYMVIFGAIGQWGIKIWTNGKVIVDNKLIYILGLWLVVQGTIYWLSTFLHSISDFAFELKCYGFTAIALYGISISLAKDLGLLGICIAMLASLFSMSLIPMILRVSSKLNIHLRVC